MNHSRKPVSDWQLERLAQGELDSSAARAVEDKLGAERTKQELAALDASNQEILARLPAEVVAPAIRRRLEGSGRRKQLLMSLAPVLVVGAAVALALARPGSGPVGVRLPDGSDETILIKGQSRLLAYVRGPRPARLTPASRVRPHDVLQLAYIAGDARYGLILSIDGRGAVTQHLPESTSVVAAALSAAGEVRLPRSYELDDAPGFERFFLVTSPTSFSAAEVLDAARALARTPEEARRNPLPVAPALRQESLLLEKVHP
jgi:hypothetical protein